MTIDTALVSKLADAFVADLRANVSPADFAEIRRRNATPAYDRACASHDFIDANECMDAAFRAVLGRAPEGTGLSPEVYADPDLTDGDIWALEAQAHARHEADLALWNAAWDLAKARSLTLTS